MLTGGMRAIGAARRGAARHGATTVEKMLLFVYTGDVVLELEMLGLLIAAEMSCSCPKILLELIPQDELQIGAGAHGGAGHGATRVANADKRSETCWRT
ncbi:uncharacterized protein IUM83_15312 [Phytophthora cinnamomi]|uniref:uncharacterized protein n=1 Tax=Phytophthora cinnamomi TaxID=4785 RepID=UPI00355A9FE9|nr:hypothetical protein IUM83_15312 [Phytophthora cinnamomi]